MWRVRRKCALQLTVDLPRKPALHLTAFAGARAPAAHDERDHVAPVNDGGRCVGNVVEDGVVRHYRMGSARRLGIGAGSNSSSATRASTRAANLYRARSSATKKRANETNDIANVANMLLGSDGCPGLSTIGIGCSVRNRYTLRWMNGTSSAPRTPSTAEYRARV